MMTIMTNIANTYAEGMSQTAVWAGAHPVMTCLSIAAMLVLGISLIVAATKID